MFIPSSIKSGNYELGNLGLEKLPKMNLAEMNKLKYGLLFDTFFSFSKLISTQISNHTGICKNFFDILSVLKFLTFYLTTY